MKEMIFIVIGMAAGAITYRYHANPEISWVGPALLGLVVIGAVWASLSTFFGGYFSRSPSGNRRRHPSGD